MMALTNVNPNCFIVKCRGAEEATFLPRVSSPYTGTRTLQRRPWPVRSDLCLTGVRVVELHRPVVDRVHRGEGRPHQRT